jgi:hypothetical protein
MTSLVPLEVQMIHSNEELKILTWVLFVLRIGTNSSTPAWEWKP